MSQAYDLLLTNGVVYDAAQGLRGARKDIAIRDGRVALVADRIDLAAAREVHDVAGRCVSPGWIDLHVHGYGGLALRDIQAVGILTGVTACVDAGDFGTLTVDDFMAVRRDSVADMYGFVHMHPAGIPYTGFARGDYGTIPVGRLIQLIDKSRDVIRGLKLSAFGDMPLHNLKVAKVIAEAARVPFYVHLGEVNHYPTKKSMTRQTADLLTEGDIITHLYTNDHGRILDEQGRVFPEVLEARARGVVFDIGHGIGNFSFDIAERALAQGVGPDVLSSDQNTLCHSSPSDLATTLSKFLVLGLSVEDVIDKVTRAPSQALGLSAHGTLAAETAADVTVFRVERGDFEFSDMDGKTRRGAQRIVPETVYKAGRRHACDADGLFTEQNFKMTTQDPARIAVDRFGAAERRFVTTLLLDLERAGVSKADAVHVQAHQAMAAAGIPTAEGLRTLYRVAFGDEGPAFTPQIGWLLARLGPEQLRRFREVLA
jgi:dihydroorotase